MQEQLHSDIREARAKSLVILKTMFPPSAPLVPHDVLALAIATAAMSLRLHAVISEPLKERMFAGDAHLLMGVRGIETMNEVALELAAEFEAAASRELHKN